MSFYLYCSKMYLWLSKLFRAGKNIGAEKEDTKEDKIVRWKKFKKSNRDWRHLINFVSSFGYKNWLKHLDLEMFPNVWISRLTYIWT